MDEKDIKKLVQIRAGHRSFVTKTIEKISNIVSDFDGNQASKLKALEAVLNEKIEVLKSLDESILEGTLPEEIESEINNASDIFEKIHESLFDIKSCLQPPDESKLMSTLNSLNLGTTGTTNKGVRLPKIELKKFHGDPKVWQSWWESFETTIHQNEGISKIDKMNYLRSLLQGNALSAIQGLGLSSQNYDDAIEILQGRFGTKMVVISSHMDALMKLQEVKSIGDTKGLRILYDKIETHIRSLRALGIDSENYGCMLIPIIMARMPTELKLLITRQLDPHSEKWDIDDLLKLFQNELTARERITDVNACDRKIEMRNNERRVPPTSAGLFAAAKKVDNSAAVMSRHGGGQTEVMRCVFCAQNHNSSACSVVVDVSKRREIVMKNGRCFICLSKGHVARNCRKKKNCARCQQKHHTCLCGEETETSALSMEQAQYLNEIRRRRTDELMPEYGLLSMENDYRKTQNAKPLQAMRATQQMNESRNAESEKTQNTRTPQEMLNAEKFRSPYASGTQKSQAMRSWGPDSDKTMQRSQGCVEERPLAQGDFGLINSCNEQQFAKHARNATQFETSGQLIVNSKTSSLLMTAKVFATNVNEPSKRVVVRVVIDSGSHKSHITKRLQERLELKNIGSKILNVGTFGEKTGKVRRTETVQLRLCSTTSSEEVVVTACTSPVICPPMDNKKVVVATQNFHHLRGLEFADGDEMNEIADVDVLIGQDYYWLIMRDPIIRGEAWEPVAQESIFGWVLSGIITDNCEPPAQPESSLLIQSSQSCELNDMLERFWKVESFGIDETENECENVNAQFIETVRHNGERYEVSLPWRKNAGVVGDNYAQARTRLLSLRRKLNDNESLKTEYSKVFEAQVAEGIIERVIEEKTPNFGNCYYMPHHAVVKLDRETTKVRVVYDASSKSSGLSLNQALHQGPSLLTEIYKVLMRFRWHKVALTADIEKAFLNIAVSKPDRDFLRLLWFENPLDIQSPIATYRFTRVVFGVTSSPYHLNATVRYHLLKYALEHPTIVAEVLKSLYVDDYTGGSENDTGGTELYYALNEMMESGGFKLRKWATNSKALREIIENDTRATEPICTGETTPKIGESQTYAECTIASPEKCEGEFIKRVLGMAWNVETDEIVYTFDSFVDSLKELRRSKRGLLGVIARLYDPLGLISPVTTKLKASFQVLCANKLGWDDPLDVETRKTWNSMLAALDSPKPIAVPRCYSKLLGGSISSLQLHTFVDASDLAYSAICYLRIVQDGRVHVSPVTAKSRVAPLKMISSPRPELTTPRLELLAAVMGSKLSETVCEVLSSLCSLQLVRFWSDSMTVLYWIRGKEREYKQFVENRLSKIRSRSEVSDWYHVPGECNPADIGSRGATVSELANSDLWWKGPKWLCEGEEKWPKSTKLGGPTEESVKEMKAEVLKGKTVACEKVLLMSEVASSERFGSLCKLLRVTAYVLRFINNLRRCSDRISGELTASEICKAERTWILSVQREMKSEEGFERKYNQFSMYQDEHGIIRCRSRLKNAEVDEGAKNPIALKHDHWISKLIVRDCHERVYHNGVSETVALVKTKYFIPRCRQIAKGLIRSCFVCRRIDSKPYNWRTDPPLPDMRVSVKHPFSATGVDLAGPLYVQERFVDDKKSIKVHIVLFTCAGTRAVHLELVDDCTASRFIRSLRRFIGRRGKPNILVSDNATNFASKETQAFLARHRIEWRPTVSNAPWYGGMYERLIRSVKRCLKKVLGGAKLTLDELQTVIVEIEAVLNNRPLTYVDNDDIREPITPNHLSFGHRLTMLDDVTLTEDYDMPEKLTGSTVRQRLRHKLKVLDDFTKRWYKEYLLELRDHRNTIKRDSKQIVSVGDVVLIEDDNPRQLWKMAKVEELIFSKDGECRAVNLTVTGSKNLLQRPIRKLFPLEFADEIPGGHSLPIEELKMVPKNNVLVPPQGKLVNNIDATGDSLDAQVSLPNNNAQTGIVEVVKGGKMKLATRETLAKQLS